LRNVAPARTDAAVALALAVFTAVLCVLSGPNSFDGTDGPEFAVAGLRMEIAHSPGYPLFIWLLRLSGGTDYNGFRVFGCMISGLAASGVYLAIRSFRRDPVPSAIGSLVLVSSGAVMAQLNTLEVHGLALLLASLAIALRETRLGPYAMSMSVFGGHPLSALLVPLAVNRSWRRTWPLALIPATIWLYVPLRAQSAMVMHYAVGSGVQGFLHYMTMYSGKLSTISVTGLWTTVLSAGLPTVAVFILAACFGRIDRRTIATLAGVLPLFLFYDVPDIQTYSWLLLLPMAVVAASGLQRLTEKGNRYFRMLMVLLIPGSVVSGILTGWDRAGGAMQIITSDMLRGIPPGRVLCTKDGTAYYCAYLLEVEDRRPDLMPVDRYGLVFPYSRLYGPLRQVPSLIASRYVHAIGAWGNLPPSGLLFSAEGGRLAWDEYDVFSSELNPPESIARDLLAELWCLRAVQESDCHRTMSAFEKAGEFAESEGARSAVNRMIDSYSRHGTQ
jgi:hypothetical protein